MNEIPNWDEYYINMCIQAAKRSKDRSTILGSIIVGPDHSPLSMGYNSFPRGLDDDYEPFHERPTKYLITEHAERNAIYNAARNGIAVKGATIYVPFEPTPCCRCTRGVIQAGIVKIVGTNVKFTGKGKMWEQDLALANKMLEQAGVEQKVVNVSGDLDIRNFQRN